MVRILALALVLILCTPLSSRADEGAGLIHSDVQGALSKGLWRNQNRSEINYLLKNLPAFNKNKATQQIKRNLLLSNYDTSEIINDIEPLKAGDDLLTLRLHKLLEMGLWEDAHKLYTDTTEDPGNNAALAEVGVMLILNQKGLSTACLEEKVFHERFKDINFWKEIDTVCAIELGTPTTAPLEFPESSVLQAIFFTPDFKINANDIEKLNKLSPLEISMLSLKGQIDYSLIDLSGPISPYIVKTYLKDKTFPEKYKAALEQVAQKLILMPLPPLSDEERAQALSAQSLPQAQVLGLITAYLARDQEIPLTLATRLQDLAPEHPENYYFMKLLETIKATKVIFDNTSDNFNLGLEIIRKNSPQGVILLQSTLDKPVEFSNNLDVAYEKQVSLTPEGDYVMSKDISEGGLLKWLEATTANRFNGLSLLIILSNNGNNAKGDEEYSSIKSLSTVGLIDQAHLIAREVLADMMKSTL